MFSFTHIHIRFKKSTTYIYKRKQSHGVRYVCRNARPPPPPKKKKEKKKKKIFFFLFYYLFTKGYSITLLTSISFGAYKGLFINLAFVFRNAFLTKVDAIV
jgi:hypothetical protein